MFRQWRYKKNEDNSLIHRLDQLSYSDIQYDKIKFWDINYKGWVDCDNLMHEYKIQKEVIVDNELIFYIYK